jgi:putative ABC transport system permease protein
MDEQERRVGLLKAAGATPSLAAIVLLAEHLVIAVCAAAAGLAAGWLAAPLLTSPGASLIGAPGSPAFSVPIVLLVVIVALAVATASTLVPALRAARVSTVRLLAGAAGPPRRQAWLIRLSSGLPVPLLLGLRLVARRPPQMTGFNARQVHDRLGMAAGADCALAAPVASQEKTVWVVPDGDLQNIRGDS